jgi:hypothetical protein
MRRVSLGKRLGPPEGGPKKDPAATYSPRAVRPKYHRR